MAGDNHLSSLLSDMRLSRKLSIRKMAEICGVSRESIRKYEKGAMIPSNQALQKILKKLKVCDQKSRQVQLYVYQARRERSNTDIRSFGSAAQAELEVMLSSQEMNDAKAAKIVELFFSEVDAERRTDSFEWFLQNKISTILRS